MSEQAKNLSQKAKFCGFMNQWVDFMRSWPLSNCCYGCFNCDYKRKHIKTNYYKQKTRKIEKEGIDEK